MKVFKKSRKLKNLNIIKYFSILPNTNTKYTLHALLIISLSCRSEIHQQNSKTFWDSIC